MATAEKLFTQAVHRQQAGDLDAARALYAKLLKRDGRNLRALVNLGALLQTAGQTADAVRLFKRALKVDARQPGVHANLGIGLSTLGRHGEALKHLHTALGLAADNPLIHLNLANALKAAGRHADAEGHYRRTLAMQPHNGLALNNLGDLLRLMGRPDEAVPLLEQAAALAPDEPEVQTRLAHALRSAGRDEDAITCFERALAATPDHAPALNGLGLALYERGAFDRAESYLRRGLASAPDRVEIHYNLGNALKALGRFDEALAAYDAALALAPDDAEACLNRGVLRLYMGDFPNGWLDYAARWRVAEPTSPPRDFGVPAWDGEPLDGKRVLVYGEQGPGDVVMFASCLPDLIAVAASVELRVEPRLAALLARSFPDARVVVDRPAADTAEPAPDDIDYAVAIGSLPRAFRPDEAHFPKRDRYLVPDPAAVARWRARLDALGDGLKVGISWRGGVTVFERTMRTMTLEDWQPILQVPGVRFVNLQYGERAKEIAAVEARHGTPIADWPDAVDDLDDFAAQVEALDLVITIAGTAVHFACALGKPTWVLTPLVPSWRWMNERSDCLWYPTATLIRQREAGDWAPVIRAIADKLAGHLQR